MKRYYEKYSLYVVYGKNQETIDKIYNSVFKNANKSKENQSYSNFIQNIKDNLKKTGCEKISNKWMGAGAELNKDNKPTGRALVVIFDKDKTDKDTDIIEVKKEISVFADGEVKTRLYIELED